MFGVMMVQDDPEQHDFVIITKQDIENLYNQTLVDAANKANITQKQLLLVLKLVTLASRPLTLDELAAALHFKLPGDSSLDASRGNIRAAFEYILDFKSDDSVHLKDKSLLDYLYDQYRETPHPRPLFCTIIDPGREHAQLFQLCYRYLVKAYKAENDAPPQNLDWKARDRLYRTKVAEYPFLPYALNAWTHHAQAYEANLTPETSHRSTPLHDLREFIENDGPDFHAFVDQHLHLSEAALGERRLPLLHLATSTGLFHFTESLIKDVAALDSGDADGRTALHHAARGGHAKVAFLLVRYGANTGAMDCKGTMALDEARQRGFEKIVKLLMRAGIGRPGREASGCFVLDPRREWGWVVEHWSKGSLSSVD